jgi:hypothetical protein
MSNLISSSTRTLLYGATIFSAILVSGVAINYVLAGSPDEEDAGAKLTADVASGEITQEQAEGLKAREDPRRWPTEDVKARMQAALASGKITQEQADERLEAWKKDQAEGLKARGNFRKIDVEDVQTEIRAALASGKITQEQYDEKLAWLEANEDSSRKD